MSNIPAYLYKNGEAKLFTDEKSLKDALKNGYKDTPSNKEGN